jgi:flagellin-like protein
MPSHVKFFANKNGVSPLIATVLLIAFAVALGAVIMNWGRGFVQERTEDVDKTTRIETGCALDVNVKVAKIGTTPQMCYGGGGVVGYLEFTLNNEGRADIKEISATIIGTLGTYNNASINSTAIVAGLTSSLVNVSYDYTTYGNIKLVRIIPKIDVAGVTTPCSGAALEKAAADIRNCSAT